jgi:hypothetical protein
VSAVRLLGDRDEILMMVGYQHLSMSIWATIIGAFTADDGEGVEEQLGADEYEYSTVAKLIRRFEGFAGVYVTDTDGNDLDPDDLPNYKAPDGGADCIIYISPDDYTPGGFISMCTQVRNILANGDF